MLLATLVAVHISLDAILAVNLTVATIVFTHWTSCCWGMLEENVGEDQGKFVASVYWSLTTMTTVGFGDITPSTVDGRWYTISMMILGSCFTAGVIANITAMAHKIVISEDNAQHVTTCVEKYMLEKDIPWELRYVVARSEATSCERPQLDHNSSSLVALV